ncbi:hypothetical protein NTCA1_51620 [Novosphingobium sp. TCA1]|nr:hypothetical protein NTCA1_51620 [Novosphingobium sp. TCA1]
MKSALAGPTTNYKPGDIVTTDEGARWVKFGIAEPFEAPSAKPVGALETATRAAVKETATRRRTKVAK